MHVTDSLTLGGKERMLVEIANQLFRRGIGVSVCVTRTDLALADELETSIPLMALERRSTFDLRGFKRLAAFLHACQPDILHVHGRSTFSFLMVARFLGLFSGPLILHDHYGSIEIDQHVPAWFRWWGRWQLARYVGVYSKLAAWALQAGVPAQRVSVIDNALDLRRFRETDDLDWCQLLHSSGLRGVVVGRICPDKGLDVLLRAIASCSERQRFQVAWVGPVNDISYYHDCLKLQNQLGLQDRVVFIGARTDIPALLKGADFAILPSRSESGPLALVEYMAAGLPFVASQVGSLSQRVVEFGLSEFVPAGESQPLSKGLARLVTLDAEERRQRGQQGQDLAFTHFDIQMVIPRWFDLYAELMEQ